MTETPEQNSPVTTTPKPPKPLRKGALVRVNRTIFTSSLEAQASDPIASEYLFEGPGEVLSVKGDLAQVRWRLPVPDVWLPVNQLEAWIQASTDS